MGERRAAKRVSAPSARLWETIVDGIFSMHATDSLKGFLTEPGPSRKGKRCAMQEVSQAFSSM